MRAIGAALVLSLGTAGCSASAGLPELQLYAASSLTEVIESLSREFERREACDVVTTLAGSGVLRFQIEQGAPADLFASADDRHVQALVQRELIDDRTLLAHNQLVIIVPTSNPAGLESPLDLPRAERIVIGAPSTPIGNYTRTFLEQADRRYGQRYRARVLAHVVSEENNVRQVRAKVAMGQADAAIVYRTDALRMAGVRALPIEPELNVQVTYHLGVLTHSARRTLAHRWADFTSSSAGRSLLREHGLRPP